MSLPTLLERWQLAPSDVAEEEWFTVNPRLHPHFDSRNIPFRLLEGTPTRQYQFSRPTISAWCRFFIVILRLVKEKVALSDMQPASITELNKAFSMLNFLLYDNRAFETLLTLPSLKNDVNDAMKTAEQRRRSESGEYFRENRSFSCSILNASDKSLDISPLDEGFDPEDGSRSPILRCCKAMLAWLRAGASLSSSKLFQGPLPKFHLVRSYVPIHTSSMMNLRDLMTSIILPKLQPSPDTDNTALSNY